MMTVIVSLAILSVVFMGLKVFDISVSEVFKAGLAKLKGLFNKNK